MCKVQCRYTAAGNSTVAHSGGNGITERRQRDAIRAIIKQNNAHIAIVYASPITINKINFSRVLATESADIDWDRAIIAFAGCRKRAGKTALTSHRGGTSPQVTGHFINNEHYKDNTQPVSVINFNLTNICPVHYSAHAWCTSLPSLKANTQLHYQSISSEC